MPTLATTSMSSKGQVLIPEAVRTALGLQPGTQFVVVGERDVLLLKMISQPSLKDFDALIAKTRQAARQVGIKKADVRAAIAKVREHR